MILFEHLAHDPADGFDYLPQSAVYLDSACQSLRPRLVIDAVNQYYQEYNSCGERVRYDWGLKVDAAVNDVRAAILKRLKLSSRDYFVSFTLNTTYGLNLLESQLDTSHFRQIITSDIEHNSVFLSTMSLAHRSGLPRIVVSRNADGSVDLDKVDFDRAIVIMNAVSNIDCRTLSNVKELVKRVHASGGIVIIDAAQVMAHYCKLLQAVPADAICFSAHKMYGPSLGVLVVRRSLLDQMQISFVGGGMVDDVLQDSCQLSAKNKSHAHTAFEPGLQLYAEIIGLGAALKWMEQSESQAKTMQYATKVFDALKAAPNITLINQQPTPTLSFYHNNFDSHFIAKALSQHGIMARSGYFCVHYYLKHVKKYPPLVRLSFGMHNRASDVDRLLSTMRELLK